MTQGQLNLTFKWTTIDLECICVSSEKPESELDKVRDKYLESAADKAGESTVDYASQQLQNGDVQQSYDNAKAQAEVRIFLMPTLLEDCWLIHWAILYPTRGSSLNTVAAFRPFLDVVPS